MQRGKRSSFGSTLNEIQDNLIYCELHEDITHATSSAKEDNFVVLRNRASSEQTLVRIKVSGETTINLGSESQVKSIFCSGESSCVYILFENG